MPVERLKGEAQALNRVWQSAMLYDIQAAFEEENFSSG
jgi:hypothetical protein